MRVPAVRERPIPGHRRNFAKLFDVQNKKFITISCCQCGYTELYKSMGSTGWDILDFLVGN